MRIILVSRVIPGLVFICDVPGYSQQQGYRCYSQTVLKIEFSRSISIRIIFKPKKSSDIYNLY
jgi:hypothetical protein